MDHYQAQSERGVVISVHYKLSDSPVDYEILVPGDTVEVSLEGKIYDTIIDSRGVQRFRKNTVLDFMFRHDKDGRPLNMTDGRDIHNGMLNLNTLAVAFHQDKLDMRDYCEVVMSGYSVSGFLDHHEFAAWRLQNPVWGDTEPKRIMSEESEDAFKEIAADYAKSLSNPTHGVD
jgi:hypothetical protein